MKKNGLQKGGSAALSSIFKNLAVPSGLLFQPERQTGGGEKKTVYYDEEAEDDDKNQKEEEVLNQDIYEKLLQMIEVNEKSLKKKTQKERKSTNKKNGAKATRKKKLDTQ